MKSKLFLVMAAAVVIAIFGFRKNGSEDAINGAWQIKTAGTEDLLLFIDGYFTHTTYDKGAKKFVQTRGGQFSFGKNGFTVQFEFDTRDKDQVGKTVNYTGMIKEGKLMTNLSGKERGWNRVDNGNAPLAGLWAITARKQNGELQPIHQTGTRKTVKILTGTRFQWAAIDPGTQQFMGTGGGTYSFHDGKYTEQIEFFSRDSSRVGSSLSFDGKLESGNWHHSGLSSRGEPIYEVWSRNN
jgi:hypothetical protein